jgi:hypothetical protein
MNDCCCCSFLLLTYSAAATKASFLIACWPAPTNYLLAAVSIFMHLSLIFPYPFLPSTDKLLSSVMIVGG